MDVGSALGSVLAAFGLSGAAGLNAWLPLLAGALLDRLGWIELAAPFDDLSTTPGLIVLAVLFVADLVGDKVPVVDSLLHAVGAVVAPVSGAALFAGQTGTETDLPALVAAVLGAVTAGGVHAGRAAARPAATAGTLGTTNPVISAAEDGVSALLTALAFVVPIVAALLVVALVVLLVHGARRVRSRLRPG
jgi:Domain of unknown function (DUF4126)